MKLYFSYGLEEREGFVTANPEDLSFYENESIEEIQGQDVLEKVPDLIYFIDECYRILKPGSKCVFSSQHFANSGAWRSPLTKRGISEQSLNFASKEWREQFKFTEAEVSADFEVLGSFAIEQDVLQRNEETRAFWMRRYLNIANCVFFTLNKKEKE
ncbi:MAG: hypothetical protein BWY21_00368 [Parcubacteria group bacterium ADurb.Bin216]|nr:MAG: hypothetical protein BWY21_00368 [Parcubacteria group bacterium ADurb.Bin216]